MNQTQLESKYMFLKKKREELIINVRMASKEKEEMLKRIEKLGIDPNKLAEEIKRLKKEIEDITLDIANRLDKINGLFETSQNS